MKGHVPFSLRSGQKRKQKRRTELTWVRTYASPNLSRKLQVTSLPRPSLPPNASWQPRRSAGVLRERESSSSLLPSWRRAPPPLISWVQPLPSWVCLLPSSPLVQRHRSAMHALAATGQYRNRYLPECLKLPCTILPDRYRELVQPP